MRYISIEDAHSKVKKNELILLDIREPYELDICSIDSVQIPMADVISRINEIPTKSDVAIMCKSGKRAEAMANILITEHEMENVYVLQGGMLAWIKKIDTHLESY